MEITSAAPAGRQVIESYGAGRFTVSGEIYQGAVLVTPERTLAWAQQPEAAITENSLAPLWRDPAKPLDLLLIGCGTRIVPLDESLRRALRARGLMAEVMDTGAACRTYNVLLAESRRVAAALVPVD